MERKSYLFVSVVGDFTGKLIRKMMQYPFGNSIFVDKMTKFLLHGSNGFVVDAAGNDISEVR